jgi:hypothetical protein
VVIPTLPLDQTRFVALALARSARGGGGGGGGVGGIGDGGVVPSGGAAGGAAGDSLRCLSSRGRVELDVGVELGLAMSAGSPRLARGEMKVEIPELPTCSALISDPSLFPCAASIWSAWISSVSLRILP